MNTNFIEQLEIKDIKFHLPRYNFHTAMYVDFRIKNHFYSLIVHKKGEYWIPDSVMHLDRDSKQKEVCSICKDITFDCLIFNPYLDDILKRLISLEPSVRLRFLFNYPMKKIK